MKRLIFLLNAVLLTAISFGQSVDFKDSSNDTLITINDEGLNKSSITIQNSDSAPGILTDKLYNVGHSLFWNGSMLGSSGSSIWSLNGSDTYYNSGKVGIGTTNPIAPLTIYDATTSHVTFLTSTTGTGTNDGFLVGLDGSTGAYLWNYENSPLNIGTNDSHNIVISPDGNVGIGSTTPSEKLHLLGDFRMDDASPYLNFYSGTTQMGNIGFWTDNNLNIINRGATSAIVFATNAAEKMRITADGNVGIGTTSPNTLNKLHVVNDEYAILGESSNGETGISGKSTEPGGRGVYGVGYRQGGWFESWNSDGTGVYGRAGGLFGGYGVRGDAEGAGGIGVYGEATNNGGVTNYGGYFKAPGSSGNGVYGEAASTNGNGGYFTGGFRGVYGEGSYSLTGINYGGYFLAKSSEGIGVEGSATHTGDYLNYGGYFKSSGKLGRGVYGVADGWFGTGVYGEATFNGGVTNYGGFFKAYGSNGRGVYGEASGGGGRGVHGVATDNSAIFQIYGGYFEAAGVLGIGAYGKATGDNGRGVTGVAEGLTGVAVEGWANNSGDTTNYGGYFRAKGLTGIGVYGRSDGSDGTGVVAYGKDYDFDAIGSGVNYGATSSIRWKKNIVEIDKPLDKLAQLRGVYFDWDEAHGGGHDVGMIAEEVGKVLPEIVVYEENGIDADGMDYSKLSPLLVEAVKALVAENELLKAEMITMEVEMKTMKTEHKEMISRLDFIEAVIKTSMLKEQKSE
jgi:hypothetical protein